MGQNVQEFTVSVFLGPAFLFAGLRILLASIKGGSCAGLTQHDDVEHELIGFRFPSDMGSNRCLANQISCNIIALQTVANLSKHHICLMSIRLTSFCMRKSRRNGFKPIQSMQISEPVKIKTSKSIPFCVLIILPQYY